jgi:hypothetical protein
MGWPAGREYGRAEEYRDIQLKRGDAINQLTPVRQNHFVACGFQHQRVGQVVDVF